MLEQFGIPVVLLRESVATIHYLFWRNAKPIIIKTITTTVIAIVTVGSHSNPIKKK